MENSIPSTLTDFLELHWSIIPCKLDKRPLIPSWKEFQAHPPTREQIEAWVKQLHPPAWAVVCGGVSGVIVLDFDGAQGMETMKRLGLKPHVLTPNGGAHVYLQHPGWRVATLNAKSKRKLGELWPGLDLRADGGYAIFLGRNQGGEYRWLRAPVLDSLDLLPMELRQFLGLTHPPNQTPAQTDIATRTADGATAECAETLIQKALDLARMEGRNNAGFLLACDLRDSGFSETDAASVMRAYVARVPPTDQHGRGEPYTEREALESLRQAYTRPPREPRGATPATGPAAAGTPPPAELAPAVIPAEKVPQVPDKAWHPLAEEYYELVGSYSETPPAFLLAAFLAGIGVALGRCIYLDHFGPLYPNIWAVLVGQSARTHKDYALRRHTKLARALYEDLPILSTVDSREGLIKELAGYQKKLGEEKPMVAMLLMSEMRTLIDKASKESLRNIIPTLAELYTCPSFIENSTVKAQTRVKDPTVSFLAGTTEAWLQKLRAEDVEGGLGNRVMWVAGARTRLISHATPFPGEAWRKLILKLGGALQFWRERRDPEIKMESAAAEYWNSLYQDKYGQDVKVPVISVLAARAQEHCLKTAMIYAALEMSDTIRCEHLQRAEAWTDFLVAGLWYLFTEFGLSPLAKYEKRIITYVGKAHPGGVSRQAVFDACKPVDAQTFGKVFEALVKEGEVVPVKVGRLIRFFGRPHTESKGA